MFNMARSYNFYVQIEHCIALLSSLTFHVERCPLLSVGSNLILKVLVSFNQNINVNYLFSWVIFD